MYLWLALRAFFATLLNGQTAARVRAALDGGTASSPAASTKPTAPRDAAKPPPASPPPSGRSDALTLLAALQREGRLLDFLQEDLTSYADAQIGAVARDLHRDCRGVVERMFAIRPLAEQPEGSPLELAAGFDAGRYRLLGNAGGGAAVRGTLLHPGWQATKCELPHWSGGEGARRVLAPAEVEAR